MSISRWGLLLVLNLNVISVTVAEPIADSIAINPLPVPPIAGIDAPFLFINMRHEFLSTDGHGNASLLNSSQVGQWHAWGEQLEWFSSAYQTQIQPQAYLNIVVGVGRNNQFLPQQNLYISLIDQRNGASAITEGSCNLAMVDNQYQAEQRMICMIDFQLPYEQTFDPCYDSLFGVFRCSPQPGNELTLKIEQRFSDARKNKLILRHGFQI